MGGGASFDQMKFSSIFPTRLFIKVLNQNVINKNVLEINMNANFL